MFIQNQETGHLQSSCQRVQARALLKQHFLDGFWICKAFTFLHSSTVHCVIVGISGSLVTFFDEGVCFINYPVSHLAHTRVFICMFTLISLYVLIVFHKQLGWLIYQSPLISLVCCTSDVNTGEMAKADVDFMQA